VSWAKLDDRYDDNRKIKRAWKRNPRAVGIHAMAITYSSRHNTDGRIDIDWLEDRLPKQSDRDKTIAVLVDTGLFDVIDEETWQVHDYLEYNASKEGREEQSHAAREAARVRWAKAEEAKRIAAEEARRNAEADAERNAQRNAERIPDCNADPMLPPARPGPSEEKETPKPPQPNIEERAIELGFDEWLADHAAVTGKTIPAKGTKTRADRAAQYVACCKEVPAPALESLKLATRAAHADPHRLENGYDGAENVLRVKKVLGLVDNGRRLANGMQGGKPPTLREIQAAQQARQEREGRAA